MPRPCKLRTIHSPNEYNYFKPRGVPLSQIEEIELTIDELEAVKLADFENLYQADAAKKMNISRQTFGNIIKSAHKKIANALINGKAIRIQGGAVKIKK
ncbi:DUF134 domain-containing protein [Lentisphaerota bacterium WC36G]|nr:DUF134 domain-containing protein [Lentisphaerae bacterium WC36]